MILVAVAGYRLDLTGKNYGRVKLEMLIRTITRCCNALIPIDAKIPVCYKISVMYC